MSLFTPVSGRLQVEGCVQHALLRAHRQLSRGGGGLCVARGALRREGPSGDGSQDTLHKTVHIIARRPRSERQVHRLCWKIVAWVTKFPSKSRSSQVAHGSSVDFGGIWREKVWGESQALAHQTRGFT